VYAKRRMPFPITCAACQKTFTIADDVYERKVKGRVVTIKCKQCQSGIRVDGTKDTPVFSVSDSVHPPPAAPVKEPVTAESPLAAPAPPAPVQPKTATPAGAKEAPKPAPIRVQPGALTPKSPVVAVARVAAVAAPKTALTGAAPKAPLAQKAPAAGASSAVRTPLVTAGPKAPAAASAMKVQPIATGPKAAMSAPKTAAQAAPIAAATAAKAASAAAAVPAPKAAAPETEVAPAETAVPAVPIAGAVPVAATAALEAAGVAAAPEPIAASAATENLWAVEHPDGEDRELTRLEIEKALAAGTINLSTLVWREGMAEWLELAQLPELRALAASPKAPPPPAAAPLEMPAQRPKAPSAPALEMPPLSATLPHPEPALPKPPAASPPAPSAPVIDFATHGGLKATPPAPIPKLPPALGGARDPRVPNPPFFSTSAQPVKADMPPAFPASLPAPRIVSAGAAVVRPNPMPIGRTFAPTASVDEWPERKSRAPLIIGGMVLAIAGAAGFFVLGSRADRSPPPSPISALPPVAPTTTHPTEATPSPTPDSPSRTDPGQGPGSSAALQPPGSPARATPNAGFAELFATGARNADEKRGVNGPTQRFDVNAAKSALASAAVDTAQCRENGGPTGIATVVVTFDPSGKVSSAIVSDPPFAGTSSGACIAAAMKRATVPAFSGLPGTATKIISLQ
jgi:hypothetical protein